MTIISSVVTVFHIVKPINHNTPMKMNCKTSIQIAIQSPVKITFFLFFINTGSKNQAGTKSNKCQIIKLLW